MPENNSAPHTFVKDGVFYFTRRVPTGLRMHYVSPKISYSLRTRSRSVAASRAIRAAAKLDEYWFHLRCQDADLPGKHLLRLGDGHGPVGASNGDAVITGGLRLSEGVAVYLRLKG